MKLPQYDNDTIEKIKKSRDYASICFLTCGVSEVLLQSLNSIIDNTEFPYEFIILSQGSSDEINEEINKCLARMRNNKYCLNVKAMTFPYNEGYVVGTNSLISISSGKWIIPFSDDIIVPKGWLNALVDKSKSNKKLGLIGFKNCSRKTQLLIQNPKDNRWDLDNSIMVSTICCLITREAYNKVGNLDYRFGKGVCEDDDYNLRMRVCGFNIADVDNVSIEHVHSSSWKKLLSVEERRKRLAIQNDILNQKWKPFKILKVV